MRDPLTHIEEAVKDSLCRAEPFEILRAKVLPYDVEHLVKVLFVIFSDTVYQSDPIDLVLNDLFVSQNRLLHDNVVR